MNSRRFLPLLAAFGLLLTAAAPAAAHDNDDHHDHRPANVYASQTLVTDATDPNLVNGWGIAAGPTTPWWVANNHTGTSTLYTGTGAIVPKVVSVPGDPTGMVFNGGAGFVVSSGGASGAAKFLFASEDGTISGWNGSVPIAGSNQAFVVVDSTLAGSIYKGLAIASSGGADYLYAADFHNGRVDVFNATFVKQSWSGAFEDHWLPRHYAPFGIQNLNGTIFVTFAKQDADRADEIAGHGRGFVDAFTTGGQFLGRVASRGALNAPWGLAWAPAGFGRFSGDLIVGNFGDGRLHAYRWHEGHWHFDGTLRAADHHAISIDGLWGIGFGNGSASGPQTTLYFAAGPNDENNGAFGAIWAP